MVRFYGAFDFLGHLCIVMELAGCSLMQAAFLGAPVASGLQLWPPVTTGRSWGGSAAAAAAARAAGGSAPLAGPHTPIVVIRQIALELVAGLAMLVNRCV